VILLEQRPFQHSARAADGIAGDFARYTPLLERRIVAVMFGRINDSHFSIFIIFHQFASIYPLPNNIMPRAKQEEPESLPVVLIKSKKYINRIVIPIGVHDCRAAVTNGHERRTLTSMSFSFFKGELFRVERR